MGDKVKPWATPTIGAGIAILIQKARSHCSGALTGIEYLPFFLTVLILYFADFLQQLRHNKGFKVVKVYGFITIKQSITILAQNCHFYIAGKILTM